MINITTLRPGEHFMFKDFEWICLDQNHLRQSIAIVEEREEKENATD